MTLYRELGHDIELVVTAPIGDFVRPTARRRWGRRRSELICSYEIRIERLISPPSRCARLWSSEASLRRWLFRNISSDRVVVFHCRGPRAVLLAINASRSYPQLRVIYDCRGLGSAEHDYVRSHLFSRQEPNSLSLYAQKLEALEREAASLCDAMICVSHAMKREIAERWEVSPEKIAVIPCCTDVAKADEAVASRTRTRSELGFTGRFVVAYCGSLEAWQKPRQSMALYQRIAELCPDAHFLAVTTNPALMVRLAREEGIPEQRYTIVSVPQGDVASLLAAADCALLLRDGSVVNQVASPVKLAEYLAVGLPVILTDGIGDYSDLIQQERIGMVLSPIVENWLPEIESVALENLRNIDRQKVRSIALRDLNWTPERYASVLARVGIGGD